MKQISIWDDFFLNISNEMYFQNIKTFHDTVYKNKVYPPRSLVFNAFLLTPLVNVKVVIIGQDPYHQVNQAMGLAFSVPKGIKLPPSLRNIFKEMENDLDIPPKTSGDLTYLATQGVFLFNTILTVEDGKPLSHDISAYKDFARDVISVLNAQSQPIVFILWGAKARAYKKYITSSNKLIIEGNHPSPLSANRGGFFHTKPFSQTNKFLKAHGIIPIKW